MVSDSQGEFQSSEFHQLMRATMEAFSAAWRRCDIDALMTLVGEEPVYRTSGGAVYEGRHAVRAGFAVICQPARSGEQPPEPPPQMHFFENKCLSYWTLSIPNTDFGNSVIHGVDVISFDQQARIVMKDAYRKLR